MYFHVPIILHHLSIPLPYEGGFSKVENSYITSTYYSIRDDYGVNADKTWMNRDWSYITGYSILENGGKATQRSPPDNFTRWIIT